MPVIQRAVTLATTVSDPNLVSGSAFEFARQRQVVSIGIMASQAGGLCNINSGADVVAEEFPVAVATRFPIIPDEMYYTDVQEQGDRLVISARNTAGTDTIFRLVVQTSAI